MSEPEIHRKYWEIKTNRLRALYAGIYAMCAIVAVFNLFVSTGFENMLAVGCVIVLILNEWILRSLLYDRADNVAYFDAMISVKYDFGSYPKIKDAKLFEKLRSENGQN